MSAPVEERDAAQTLLVEVLRSFNVSGPSSLGLSSSAAAGAAGATTRQPTHPTRKLGRSEQQRNTGGAAEASTYTGQQQQAAERATPQQHDHGRDADSSKREPHSAQHTATPCALRPLR